MANILHTFFRAVPGTPFAWVQVIDGRVVAAFTRSEFLRELKRLV